MALENEMKICPLCGESTLEYVNSRHWVCSECGLDLFNNVAAAVGLILYTEDNQILLEKRAKEPRKGFLALPGGFIDPDESAETACVREVKEEIGLNVKESDISFVGTSPNTYIFKNMSQKHTSNTYAYIRSEFCVGIFSNIYAANNNCKQQHSNNQTSYKTKFFANHRIYKISVFGRKEIKLSLGSLTKSFAKNATRTNCYF